MIARIWRGAVRAEDASAYAEYVQRTGIDGYRGTPGNRGAGLLWRVEGDRAEFVTVSLWESRTAIEAFAGQDIGTAVFYPDDEQFLIERDLTVNHYDVAGTEQGILLDRTADLPAVVVRVTGAHQPGIDTGALAALDVAGRAVLLHTGDDERFGSPAYVEGRHFLTRAGAAWLADHDAALVGIDALNIDDTADRQRPAHTLLLAADIPVVEHLTGLEQLPPTGAWFTAVPLRIEKLGTIPVRAFARLPARTSLRWGLCTAMPSTSTAISRRCPRDGARS